MSPFQTFQEAVSYPIPKASIFADTPAVFSAVVTVFTALK